MESTDLLRVRSEDIINQAREGCLVTHLSQIKSLKMSPGIPTLSNQDFHQPPSASPRNHFVVEQSDHRPELIGSAPNITALAALQRGT